MRLKARTTKANTNVKRVTTNDPNWIINDSISDVFTAPPPPTNQAGAPLGDTCPYSSMRNKKTGTKLPLCESKAIVVGVENRCQRGIFQVEKHSCQAPLIGVKQIDLCLALDVPKHEHQHFDQSPHAVMDHIVRHDRRLHDQSGVCEYILHIASLHVPVAFASTHSWRKG